LSAGNAKTTWKSAETWFHQNSIITKIILNYISILLTCDLTLYGQKIHAFLLTINMLLLLFLIITLLISWSKIKRNMSDPHHVRSSRRSGKNCFSAKIPLAWKKTSHARVLFSCPSMFYSRVARNYETSNYQWSSSE